MTDTEKKLLEALKQAVSALNMKPNFTVYEGKDILKAVKSYQLLSKFDKLIKEVEKP